MRRADPGRKLDPAAQSVIASYAPRGGFGFRFDPATGHLTWQLTARPTVLNFDVHYADGSQPVQSTFTASRPEYFVPRVVRCVPEAWFVYAGPHQDAPSSEVLGSGIAEYCPRNKA